MTSKNIALNFAKEKGFASVDFQEQWDGFDVYIAQSEGKVLIIGYPFFILVKDGTAREYKNSELFKLMHFAELPSDYTEKLS